MAELKFKFVGDDTDIRKKLADLAKLQSESGQAFQKAFKGGGEGVRSIQEALKQVAENTKKATTATQELGKAQSSTQVNAAKEAQLAYMDSLRQSRLEIQKQREEQARLKVSYDEGRISQQQYRIEAAKFSLEERKKAAALREAKKEISNNSEYQKLNRALGALRTESKNLLAEMYRLETQGKKGSMAYQELANKARGVTAQTKVLDGALKKIDASLGLHQRNVGNYGSALDAVSPQFARLNSQLSMMGVNLTELAGNKNAFRELGATILGVGKNIGMFLISPVGLLITAVAGFFALIRGNKGTVMDFNSGLLNVSKTTGIAGAALDKLGDDVVGLSRKLQTVGTDKLLEYATVAGQLGVKGSANIMAFTEALAKLETASDITGEKGGAEIARLLTLTDGGVQNVKDFGDEIVNLGNNFAATESEILSNATAIAQNTGLYKVGRQDVLAYATATKAVGLEAEVVGSAMFRTLAQIEKYSDGAKGSEKILALLGKTQTELSKQFKTDSSGVFNDLIAALNKIDKEGGNVTATLNQLGLNNVRDIRVLGTLASSGYGQLEQAMIDVKDAAGSLDEEFNTAAGKLVNQTERIGIAWNNLVLSIENGTGLIGTATVKAVDYFAGIFEGINYLVTSSSWKEFWARLEGGYTIGLPNELDLRNTYQGIKRINDEARELKKSTSSWIYEADFEKLGASKFNDELEKAKDNFDKMRKAAIDYEAAVRSGRIAETDLSNPFVRASVEVGQMKDTGSVDRYKLEESKAQSHYLELLKLQSKFGFKETEQAAEQGKKVTEEQTEAQKRAHETMVNAQRTMQAKIDEMNQSAKRKSMSDSEEEVQAIKDKYAKLREEAARFNKDPKNKIKVNLSGLGASESGEVSEAGYKADTVLLKKALDEQLKLYNNFEALRKSTSRKVAEERYRDQLDLIRDYEPRLQAEIAKLEGKDRSKEEEKRYKQLTEDQKKFNEARLKEEETAAIRIYNLTMTYDDKMLAVQNQYQKDVERLGTKANAENLKILNDGRKAEEQALQKSFVESIDSYKHYFENIADLSGKKLNEAIKALKKDLETLLKKHPELKKFVDEITVRLDTDKTAKTAQDFREMGSSLSFMADAVKDFGGGLYDAFRVAGDLANQVSSIKTDIADFSKFSADGNFMGQLSAGLGIIGAGFNIMTGIASLFSEGDRRQEEQFQHSQELQRKQTEAMTKVLNRQLEVIKDLYGTERLDKYNEGLKEIAKQEEDARKSISGATAFTGDKFTDDIIKDLNAGKKSLKDLNNELRLYDIQSKNTGLNPMQRQFAADNYRKLEKAIKAIGQSAVITGKETTEELLNIYALLDDGTREGIDSIIEFEKQYKESLNAMREETTGTSFTQLADDFVKSLQAEKPFEALGDQFEDVMKSALENSFKDTRFKDSMQGFYDMLDDAMSLAKSEGRTITANEIMELRKRWQEMTAEEMEYWKKMEEDTGIPFTKMMEGVRNIGISLESVQSQFAALFANGTASAEDFGNNFEEIMKSVIMNSFQTNFVAEAMKGFYQQILDLTESGNDLTEAEIALLRSQYESIVAEGQDRFAQLEKVTGMSFAVKEEIEEIKKEIDKVFSGFGDTILNSLTKPFDQVGDAFEDTMKKAILSTFRDGVLEKELQEFYQMYADMTEGGASLNAAQVDLLRAKYDEILERGKASIAELEQLTGVALKEIEKIEEVIRENLTGTSLEGVADSIVNMFSQGKNEAIDFAETFEEVMKKAVLNIFKTELIAGELKKFYDTFEQIAQGDEGLTAANMAELRLQYDLMMAGADARFRELEKVTGLSFQVIEAVQEAVEIARESIVGTTFESFADGIVEMLARGTTSVQEFGKSFEETMKTAILNTFKTKTLANEMEAFYEQFYRYTDSGGMLTEVEIAALKVQYDKMIKDGRDKLDQIEKVTGMDFTTETSATGMAGAIRRELTEQTGGELKGLYRANYDISKSLLALQAKEWAAANNYNRIGIERLTAIQANTFRTAENTELLKDIRVLLGGNSALGGGISANRYL